LAFGVSGAAPQQFLSSGRRASNANADWSQGTMSMWEADANITTSICGFMWPDVGGMESPAKNQYIENMAFCANDVLLWSASQCGRCYEVRPILPNTAAVNPNVQPTTPIVSKVVQIIDKNDHEGRNFDCNFHVFQELTGHGTDLFSLEWRPVDCEVKADEQEMFIFNKVVNVNRVTSIEIMFFNQKTSVVKVTMRAFKICGGWSENDPVTCHIQEDFDFSRRGDSAIWLNPDLGAGVAKPITFEMVLLNGEKKIFTEEDFISNQGADPFLDVWAPDDSGTTTAAPTTTVHDTAMTTVTAKTMTSLLPATTTTTTLANEDCMSCSTCLAIPGNTHAATDDQCAPCALGGQSWWPCDVEGLCQCGRNRIIASSTTTTVTTTPPNDGCMVCGVCEAIPGNPHTATDAHCSPCALGGQSWWPCNIEGLCRCAGR